MKGLDKAQREYDSQCPYDGEDYHDCDECQATCDCEYNKEECSTCTNCVVERENEQ